MAGAGPRSDQTTKATMATTMTPGTNQPETVSARRWIGARPRCASATICTIRASIVSRPTFSLRMSRPPVWLIVPPISAAPAALVTGIDLPVTIDLVDCAAAF